MTVPISREDRIHHANLRPVNARVRPGSIFAMCFFFMVVLLLWVGITFSHGIKKNADEKGESLQDHPDMYTAILEPTTMILANNINSNDLSQQHQQQQQDPGQHHRLRQQDSLPTAAMILANNTINNNNNNSRIPANIISNDSKCLGQQQQQQ